MLLAFFVVPAAEEAGPAGGSVMQALTRRGMVGALILSGVLVVLSGIYLLWRMSNHFSPGFMGSTRGILLSIGALFGLIALGIGAHVSRPTVKKLSAIGARVATSGAPPTPEDVAEMARLRGRLGTAAKLAAWSLIVAAVCMALGPHI